MWKDGLSSGLLKSMLLPIFCVTTQNKIYIPILTLTISSLIPVTLILAIVSQSNFSNQWQPPTMSLWIDRKNNRTNLFSLFFLSSEHLSAITTEFGKGKESDAKNG